VRPVINEYYESATFPNLVLEKLKPLDLLGKLLKPPYGENIRPLFKGILFIELARVDVGLATFLVV
jgi:hypothetical protein